MILFSGSTVTKIVAGVIIAGVLVFLYMKFFGSEGFENQKKSLVLFYAPWCGHCQKLKPTWAALAQKHKNDSSVEIKSVDCDKAPDQAKANGVEGFPTIIMFKGGEKKQFNGDRSLEALEAFIQT